VRLFGTPLPFDAGTLYDDISMDPEAFGRGISHLSLVPKAGRSGTRRCGGASRPVSSAGFEATQDRVRYPRSREHNLHAAHLTQAVDIHGRLDGGPLRVRRKRANNGRSNLVI
jgi:hypothetical protein